jgi:hypothetical protein
MGCTGRHPGHPGVQFSLALLIDTLARTPGDLRELTRYTLSFSQSASLSVQLSLEIIELIMNLPKLRRYILESPDVPTALSPLVESQNSARLIKFFGDALAQFTGQIRPKPDLFRKLRRA